MKTNRDVKYTTFKKKKNKKIMKNKIKKNIIKNISIKKIQSNKIKLMLFQNHILEH